MGIETFANTDDIIIASFKSNQIKSATDNNGNYSNENDNIYESAKLDDDLRYPVISLADIRDRIKPKNRENFERLVYSGVFELTC